LLQKQFSNEEIDNTLNTVIEKGYLNEKNYIRMRIRGLARKNYSMTYIQQSLLNEKLNVSTDKIEETFNEMGQSEDTQINDLIEKKLTVLQIRCEADKARNKILRHLISKGHSYNKISSILNNNFDIKFQ